MQLPYAPVHQWASMEAVDWTAGLLTPKRSVTLNNVAHPVPANNVELLQQPLLHRRLFSPYFDVELHLICTLKLITSQHHSWIQLIIPNIKGTVETASVPWTDWHSVLSVLSANTMFWKCVQLTSNVVDSIHSEARPCKGHGHCYRV